MNLVPILYGVVAEFKDQDALLAAATQARAHGYRRVEGYSPYPVEGLAEALGHGPTLVPLFTLLGGICGGLGGYFMEWYSMAIDYPLNIGGRPLNSWPSFIPITFELTVLIAALSALISMLALNGLPRPYHPVFNAPGFEHASVDRFFLCIEAADPKFDAAAVRHFFEHLDPKAIREVPQ